MRGGYRLLWLSIGMILFIPLGPIQWLARILLVLAGLSWIYSWLMREYLVVKRTHQEILLYRHTPGTAELKISNSMSLPVSSVLVVDQLGGLISNGDERRSLSLGPGQSAFLPYPIRSHNRGSYSLGPITLQGSDPLGLFPWEKRIDLPGQVLVMPKIHLLADCFHYGSPTGDIKTNNPLHQDHSRVKSFHQYEPGDDPRTISWKLSARSGVLQVSEFESSSTYPAVVVLNFASQDYGHRRVHHALERALEVAASAVHFWAQSKQEFGFITNGKPAFESTYDQADNTTDKITDNKTDDHIPLHQGSATNTTRDSDAVTQQSQHSNPMLAVPLAKGQGHGSVILRSLASLEPNTQARQHNFQSLIQQLANLRPPQGSTILYIGPPPESEELSSLITLGNRTWNTELWLLPRDSTSQPKEDLVTFLVPGTGIKALRWISEYGEELAHG
jgi:hypothetical protein